MARIKAVLWKSAKPIDHEYPVYLRIEANGQRQYISLGFRVTNNLFNRTAGAVRKPQTSSERLNRIIDNAVLDAKNAMYDLIGRYSSWSPQDDIEID